MLWCWAVYCEDRSGVVYSILSLYQFEINQKSLIVKKRWKTAREYISLMQQYTSESF
jgi:hypothetical protein